MHERYGIAAVTGTLLGSQKSPPERDRVPTPTAAMVLLKDAPKVTFVSCFARSVSLGYLIQTEGEYSVLKLGDIEAFQDKKCEYHYKKI